MTGSGDLPAKGKTPDPLRARAEEQVLTTPPDRGELERALHELQVHRIELEIQNEELRAAEAAHEATARRYRDLHDLAPSAYLTLDRGGVIIDVNRAACALLGAERRDLLGRPLARFTDAASSPLLRRCLAAVQARDGRQSCPLGLLPVVGAPLEAHLEAVALTGVDGARASLCALNDLSAERRAERASAAKLAAEQASAAKSDFLAQMSHELRTPLSGVYSAIELALLEELPAKATRYLEVAQTAASDLLALVGDVLDFAAIEARRIELTDRPFALAEALEGSLAMVREAALRKGLGLTLELDPRAPQQVRGDRRRFKQIIINLLSNAIKFTEEGTINVAFGPADEASSDPGRLSFVAVITDSGTGFDPALAEAIFAPYTQGSTDHYIRHGGTGLGLAIVRQLVELMHGRIWAESQVGIGSVFRFIIELGRVDGVCAGERVESATEATVESATVEGVTGPLRILLVEDDPVSQLVAAELLRDDGHEVIVADNGEVALPILERSSAQGGFDLVLVDHQMPRLDGPGLARIIRAGTLAQVPPDLPIIGLSALALRDDRDERDVCIDAGMDECLAKPLDRQRLYQTLAALAKARSDRA